MSSKGCLENSDITLIDHEKMITDERKLVQLFNDHYINIDVKKVEFDIGSSDENGVLGSISARKFYIRRSNDKVDSI